MYFYLIAIQLNRRWFFRHYGDIVSIQFSRKGSLFCNVSFARKEDAERVYYVCFPQYVYIYMLMLFFASINLDTYSLMHRDVVEGKFHH